jgi:hypothetical protein
MRLSRRHKNVRQDIPSRRIASPTKHTIYFAPSYITFHLTYFFSFCCAGLALALARAHGYPQIDPDVRVNLTTSRERMVTVKRVLDMPKSGRRRNSSPGFPPVASPGLTRELVSNIQKLIAFGYSNSEIIKQPPIIDTGVTYDDIEACRSLAAPRGRPPAIYEACRSLEAETMATLPVIYTDTQEKDLAQMRPSDNDSVSFLYRALRTTLDVNVSSIEKDSFADSRVGLDSTCNYEYLRSPAQPPTGTGAFKAPATPPVKAGGVLTPSNTPTTSQWYGPEAPAGPNGRQVKLPFPSSHNTIT